MTESPFKRDISVEINVKPSPCCSEYRFKQILKSIAHFKWYCLNSFTANFYFLSIQLRIDDAVFSKNMFLKASQNIWCKKKNPQESSMRFLAPQETVSWWNKATMQLCLVKHPYFLPLSVFSYFHSLSKYQLLKLYQSNLSLLVYSFTPFIFDCVSFHAFSASKKLDHQK